MTDTFTTWMEEERAKLAAALPVLEGQIAALQALMRAAGVTEMRIEFDGSGDSGDLQEIEVTGADVEAFLAQPFEGGTATVEQLAEAIANAMLDQTYIDWYNDEGGFGACVVTLEAAWVDMNVRVESSEYSQIPFTGTAPSREED